MYIYIYYFRLQPHCLRICKPPLSRVKKHVENYVKKYVGRDVGKTVWVGRSGPAIQEMFLHVVVVSR